MITAVGTNLKVGADVKLGPKTIIIGPKGSGKSTIVNAIELALTGRCGDVAGRDDVGAGTELWALAPEGHDELHANVEWRDGTAGDGIAISSWNMEQGKKPTRSGPAGVLPLRDVKEALLGSAETTRKWLLQFVSGKSWREDLGGGLAARAAALPDDLSAAIEAARQRGREARASATRLRTVVKTSAAGLPPEPGEGEIIAAQTAERAVALSAAFAETRKRRLALRAEREALGAKLTREREALAKAPTVEEADANAVDAILAAMDVQIARGGKRCAVCSAETDVQAVAARRTRLLLSARDLTLAATARREATFAVGATEADLRRVEQSLAALPSEEDPDAPLPSVAAPSTPAAELQLRRARWAALRSTEKAATDSDREADEWQSIVDLLSRRLSQSVEDGRAAFESRVQEYLPAGMVFGLALSPVRVGLKRGAALHTALSGAEWATVTLALALAASELNAEAADLHGSDAPRVIAIPEERAFNGDDLRDVLAAWKDAPVQIVMTSPVPPSVVPEGWTVITRGDTTAAFVKAVEDRIATLGAEEAALADPIAANLPPTDLGGEPEPKPEPPRVERSQAGSCGCPLGPAGRKRHAADCPRSRRKAPPSGANGSGGSPPPTPLD